MNIGGTDRVEEGNAMIYRCPGCEAGMEYSIEKQCLRCKYCGMSLSVENWAEAWNQKNEKRKKEEVEASLWTQDVSVREDGPGAEWGRDAYYYESKLNEEELKKFQRRHATIRLQILRCTACGAELAVNDTEVTSFCAYCGQSAVIKDRMEDFLEPDYVIPFKITKEQAISYVKERFSHAKFAPKEVKQISPDSVRGIYVPYWVFDVYYRDEQILRRYVKRDKNKRPEVETWYKAAECTFRRLPADGSSKFANAAADRIQPYDFREAKPFNGAYLSGFYADRFDEGAEDKTASVMRKAKELFDEAMWGGRQNGMEQMQSKADRRIVACDYVLLPTWFLTFRANDGMKTVLINGQNGKVVGTILSKPKIFLTFLVRMLLLCLVTIPVGIFMFRPLFFYNKDESYVGFLILFFLTMFLAAVYYWVRRLFDSITEGERLTRSGMQAAYSRERQEKT